jgi:hypothetical protein
MTVHLWELREQLLDAEERRSRARKEAQDASTTAILVSRRIANLPCDEDRNRDELIIHLGFVHRVHVGHGYSIEKLRAIHDRLPKEVRRG